MTPERTTPSNVPPAWQPAADDSPPINLEARLQSGDACFFAYAYLSYCRFERSGVIELYFASRVLRLEGRNLQSLYAALVKHGVSTVRQAEAGEQTAEHAASIDNIEITDLEE